MTKIQVSLARRLLGTNFAPTNENSASFKTFASAA